MNHLMLLKFIFLWRQNIFWMKHPSSVVHCIMRNTIKLCNAKCNKERQNKSANSNRPFPHFNEQWRRIKVRVDKITVNTVNAWKCSPPTSLCCYCAYALKWNAGMVYISVHPVTLCRAIQTYMYICKLLVLNYCGGCFTGLIVHGL